MKKKINIILTDNNKALGNKGEIITVSLGFALNYLIPRNLAQKVTKGTIKHNNMFVDIQNKQIEKNKKEAEIIKQQLTKINHINLYKKTGDYKQIFGSISEKEILNYLYQITGIQLNKKNIHLPNINTIGSFNISMDIMNQIQVNILLNILPENI
uniref:50S ribosomal protein L9, chloroplastic n=1 Tax=Callithamnion tetricum TaxID=193179 RepID=A0A4D6WTX2_9FLOR|nr:ribosomal protein L9 [Callithamnion tetricum]